MAVTKGNPEGGQCLDFAQAYRERHGRSPNPVRAQPIAEPATVQRKNALKVIDLESGIPDGPIEWDVSINDSVVIRAGRTSIELVFKGIENGRLICSSKKSGIENTRAFRVGEADKVWSGLLMDFSTFEVELKNLSVKEAGKLATVRISVSTESPISVA